MRMIFRIAPHRPDRRRGLARRFGASRDGATIIEFGFIALPFFALLMAILETGVMFFAGQTLDTSVGLAARMIRTGQAQEMGFDEDRFREQVCELAGLVMNCADLKLDVKVFPDFESINLTPGVGNNGEIDDSGFGFDPGHGEDIVVVRAFYNWPIFANILGFTLDSGNGSHLLSTTVAFRNEPFPW